MSRIWQPGRSNIIFSHSCTLTGQLMTPVRGRGVWPTLFRTLKNTTVAMSTRTVGIRASCCTGRLSCRPASSQLSLMKMRKVVEWSKEELQALTATRVDVRSRRLVKVEGGGGIRRTRTLFLHFTFRVLTTNPPLILPPLLELPLLGLLWTLPSWWSVYVSCSALILP